jgi:hypothetical protein
MPYRRVRLPPVAALTVAGAAAVVAVVLVVASSSRSPASLPRRSAPLATQQGTEHLAPPLPSPRIGTAMAYDGFRHEVVLFGGVNSSDLSPTQPLNDTWTFQDRRWTERDPITRPGPLSGAHMAYDALTHDCLLVWSGGRDGLAVTWQWDGTTWSRLSDVPFGADEGFEGLASDPTSGHLLLISAFGTANDVHTHTWTWDGRVWTLQHPAQALPLPQGNVTLATIGARGADRLRPGILALVPIGSGVAETWVWDGSTWAERAPGAAAPDITFDATMAEDPTTGEVVLIGSGDPVNGGNGPTWLWDGTSWQQAGFAPLTGNGATSALSDSARLHAIVFGDRTPDGRSNTFDVLWSFNGRQWDSQLPA